MTTTTYNESIDCSDGHSGVADSASTFSGRMPPPGFENQCPVGSTAFKGYRGAYATDDMVRVAFLEWVHDYLYTYPMPAESLVEERHEWRLGVLRLGSWTLKSLWRFEMWIEEYNDLKWQMRAVAGFLARLMDEGRSSAIALAFARMMIAEIAEHEKAGVGMFWVGRTWVSVDGAAAAAVVAAETSSATDGMLLSIDPTDVFFERMAKSEPRHADGRPMTHEAIMEIVQGAFGLPISSSAA